MSDAEKLENLGLKTANVAETDNSESPKLKDPK